MGSPYTRHMLFFNDPATTEIYTLSLHDALPIWSGAVYRRRDGDRQTSARGRQAGLSRSEDVRHTGNRGARRGPGGALRRAFSDGADRKSTRLNSSHLGISYAVFCL